MFAVSITTGKLLLYCQANITQRGGSFKTARLVVSYQSGIWQLLQQFICVTNKLLTEGMLNIVLKVTEVLHMRPNLAAFFLPQLGFIVEHPEGKPRCESHPAHGVFIGEGEPERSKPFPDGVHLFIGATGQRLTNRPVYPWGQYKHAPADTMHILWVLLDESCNLRAPERGRCCGRLLVSSG